jgi:hypothetical protein
MAHGTGILQKYPGRPDVALQRSLERGKKISRDANVTFSARADGGGNDGDGEEKNGTAKACGPVSGFISAATSGSISGYLQCRQFKHGNMTGCGD